MSSNCRLQRVYTIVGRRISEGSSNIATQSQNGASSSNERPFASTRPASLPEGIVGIAGGPIQWVGALHVYHCLRYICFTEWYTSKVDEVLDSGIGQGVLGSNHLHHSSICVGTRQIEAFFYTDWDAMEGFTILWCKAVKLPVTKFYNLY